MTSRMVCAVIAGAMLAACARRAEPPDPRPDAPATAQAPAPTPAPAPPRPPRQPREPEKPPELVVPLRPLDKQLLAATKGGFVAKKVGAALRDGRAKAKLRSRPAGRKQQTAEVDVDLDGDGRTDEVWRFAADGGVTRTARFKENPDEDEFKLEGQGWRLTSGTGRSAAVKILPPAPQRPIDKEVLARAGKPGENVDDATPGKPYRIALSKEQGSDRLNRARVDLDRDGKWDEMWWVEPSGVRRDVAPQDDGNHTTRYRLVGGKWFAQ